MTRAIVDAGFLISVTPELVYRERDRELVAALPPEALVVESDAPWQYEGEFEGLSSGPWLAGRVVEEVAKIKQAPVEDVMFQLSANAWPPLRLRPAVVLEEKHTVLLPGGRLALVVHLPEGRARVPLVLACHGLGAGKDSEKYALLGAEPPAPRAGARPVRLPGLR